MGLIFKNKRGIFFTILAIYLLSLFLIAYTSISLIRDRDPVNRRVETLNDFLFSLERDMPREMYVAGYRSVFLVEKYIVENGAYVDDAETRLSELITDGTLYSVTEDLMDGATIDDIFENINTSAAKINADVSYGSDSLTISQDNPWSVKFELSVDLHISDKTGLVSWDRTATYVAQVPINVFEDPLYAIGTGGLILNKITISNYSNFPDELPAHVAESYYIAHDGAPSFLQRLEVGGVDKTSPQGIESFVYVPSLPSSKTKSCIDYIYFSSNSPNYHSVPGMPSWFYIDNDHDSVYGT